MQVWLQIQGSQVRSWPSPILSWRLIMKLFLRSFFSLRLNHSRRVVVSYKRKYVHEVLLNRLFKHTQEKSVIRWTDRPAMTLAVDLDVRQQNKETLLWFLIISSFMLLSIIFIQLINCKNYQITSINYLQTWMPNIYGTIFSVLQHFRLFYS